MAGQLRQDEQFDYSGGLNAVVNPFDAGPKQVLRATNLILDEHGSLRTVDGTAIIGTAPVAENNNHLLLASSWLPVGGSIQRLVISRPDVGNSNLYSYATTPWTLIGPLVGNSTTPQLAILNNLMVFANGYNTPYQWDGAVFQALTGYPAGMGAQHIVNHEGFIFAWNTNAATTANDGPSSLRSCDLNNPNAWNNAQQTFIAKDDGTEGTGMAVYTIVEAGIAPIDALILFKDRSAFSMQGNLGTGGGLPSSNLSIQGIKTDMGCYAPRSIQFCSGFGVIRLSHRGYALYNGTDDRLISEEIRPYLFGRDDISGIDWTNVWQFWSAQCQNPPIYIGLCSVAGSHLSRAFMYDLVRTRWTVVDFPFPLASISFIAESGALPVVLLGGAAPNAGTPPVLRRWFAEDPDFDGTAINWTFRSRPAGSPLMPHYFRRLLFNIVSDTNSTGSVALTFSEGSAKTVSIACDCNLIPNLVTVDVDHNARYAYFDLTGSGKVRIRAHQWDLRNKPSRSTKL